MTPRCWGYPCSQACRFSTLRSWLNKKLSPCTHVLLALLMGLIQEGTIAQAAGRQPCHFIESLRLEKTSKIIESNCPPTTNIIHYFSGRGISTHALASLDPWLFQTVLTLTVKPSLPLTRCNLLLHYQSNCPCASGPEGEETCGEGQDRVVVLLPLLQSLEHHLRADAISHKSPSHMTVEWRPSGLVCPSHQKSEMA